jgi:hypothetical protein
MSLWEYKHITSGPHGFATSALLESYLNQLGKDEWEIISYQNLPNNALAFNGVARRTTVRDWTLEGAAAAAAKIEADKLRAEFAAKFQGNSATQDAATEQPSTLISERAATEETHRKLRDTERDSDPDAHAGEDLDEWDNYDDDLPNFFEAIKPHLRKNQRGNGQSVGVTFLAKRWEQAEGDMIGALKECGFTIPEKEDAEPEYLEFEGDLYWLNLNNRHELFINTREKPRPVYRVVAGKKLDPSASESPATQNRRPAGPNKKRVVSHTRPSTKRGVLLPKPREKPTKQRKPPHALPLSSLKLKPPRQRPQLTAPRPTKSPTRPRVSQRHPLPRSQPRMQKIPSLRCRKAKTCWMRFAPRCVAIGAAPAIRAAPFSSHVFLSTPRPTLLPHSPPRAFPCRKPPTISRSKSRLVLMFIG